MRSSETLVVSAQIGIIKSDQMEIYIVQLFCVFKYGKTINFNRRGNRYLDEEKNHRRGISLRQKYCYDLILINIRLYEFTIHITGND